MWWGSSGCGCDQVVGVVEEYHHDYDGEHGMVVNDVLGESYDSYRYLVDLRKSVFSSNFIVS